MGVILLHGSLFFPRILCMKRVKKLGSINDIYYNLAFQENSETMSQEYQHMFFPRGSYPKVHRMNHICAKYSSEHGFQISSPEKIKSL